MQPKKWTSGGDHGWHWHMIFFFHFSFFGMVGGGGEGGHACIRQKYAWAWRYMIAWKYGVVFIWDINSYARCNGAGMAWVHASNQCMLSC